MFKKYVVVATLALALIISLPGFARAQDRGDNESGIRPQTQTLSLAELQREIKRLQELIRQLTSGNSSNSNNACREIFTTDLFFGDEDFANNHNVQNLQKALEKAGYLTMPKGAHYGFFGHVTHSALDKFQNHNGIYEKYKDGYSYVGPQTRAALNRLNCTDRPGPIPPTLPPTITVLSPNKGESLTVGSGYKIIWIDGREKGVSPRYLIGLSNSNGKGLIADNIPASTHCVKQNVSSISTCSYTWEPEEISAGNYISIYDVANDPGSVIVGRSGTFSTVSSNPTNLPPTIHGVSGPTSLRVGEQGTWTVQASDPENGQLSYSVIWGDEEKILGGLSQSLAKPTFTQQSATFTHTYSTAGNFSPTFYVVDNAGNQQMTSVSVNVGGVVNTPIPNIIRVTSPNGNEVWKEGEQKNITWSSQGLPSGAKIYINLHRWPGGANKSIVRDLSASTNSYNWKVDTIDGEWGLGVAPQSSNLFSKILGVKTVYAEDGYTYKVLVAAGVEGNPYFNVYDYSDNTFRVYENPASPEVEVIPTAISANYNLNQDYDGQISIATVTFKYKLRAVNGDAYVSTNTNHYPPVTYSITGPGVPSISSVINASGSESGDTSGAFVIEEGDSREFTFVVVLDNSNGASGVRTVKVNSLQWGTNSISSSLDDRSTTLGLDSLKVTFSLDGYTSGGSGGGGGGSNSAIPSIISSNPTTNSRDAGQPKDTNGNEQGWKYLEAQMSGSVSPSDFAVAVSGGTKPNIVTDKPVTCANNSSGVCVANAYLILDRPIPAGQCTVISHKPSQTYITLKSLPGDVDGSGVVNAMDKIALTNAINGAVSYPLSQTDINRDGALNTLDSNRLTDLMNGAAPFGNWYAKSLPACPSPVF